MMPMMLLRPDGDRDRHGESGLTMTNQATTFPIDLFFRKDYKAVISINNEVSIVLGLHR